VLITFTSPSDLRHHLYIPPADPLVTMWSVAPPTLDEARAKLDSDEIEYTTKLKDKLSAFEGTIYTLPTTMEFPPLPVDLFETQATHNADVLRDALHVARMVKTEFEIELIREANRISSGAHEVLMRELGSRRGAAPEKRKGQEKRESPIGRSKVKVMPMRSLSLLADEWGKFVHIPQLICAILMF
jgi:Xaa-Pro dipeptidase